MLTAETVSNCSVAFLGFDCVKNIYFY